MKKVLWGIFDMKKCFIQIVGNFQEFYENFDIKNLGIMWKTATHDILENFI